MHRKNTYLLSLVICFLVMHTIVICGLTGCDQPSQSLDTPGSSEIIHTSEELVVDGILIEECWSDADVRPMKSAVGDDTPKLPTTVRAVFDDSKLYVGIECQDTDAASTVTGRDSAVFSEEHVTVYIDANSDRSTYAMFEIAPTGAIRDAFVVSTSDGGKEQVLTEWDCEGIRVSVNVYGGGAAPETEDRFWTVELAIPFDGLLSAPQIPPADGDNWLWNVSRVDFTNGRQLSILFPSGSERFHVPAAFARLTFNQ